MLDKNSDLKQYYNSLAEKWKSAIVAREKIGEFTGGTISPGRIANLDCVGQGPRERIRIGRKVCYPVQPLIDWLIQRSVILK